MNHQQRGFGLVELLIVLVIIALAIAFVGPRISQAFGRSDENDEIQNIQQVLGAVRDLRGSNGYGASGTNLVPQMVEDLPGAWAYNGTTLSNAFGGTVTIVSTGPAVRITSANIPGSACKAMATKLSRGQTVRSTKIGTAAALVGEVTAAAATTSCGDPDNLVSMEWTTSN